ncbi:MAG: HD domain-containing protein [Candidatus Abyssubacteria bacterium]|nr:HD domain-containing protein [Candidatus Abyssubacteria bacterium]
MKEPARAPLQYSEIARRYAEENLNGRLLEHSRECAETAQKLARKFGADVEKTLAASYLHDIAKILSRKKLLAMAREMGMPDAEIDSCPPPVLHGPVGALIARKELGIDDAEVLQAIEAHSTGCAGMCKVAKIVFVADYIELTRTFPGASELRSHGNVTLDELTRAILSKKLRHLMDEGKIIDARAIALWNDLAMESR